MPKLLFIIPLFLTGFLLVQASGPCTCCALHKIEVETVPTAGSEVQKVENNLERTDLPTPGSSQGDEVAPFVISSDQDERMQKEIEKQLFWSPFVDSGKISVSVTDGIATLTGSVNSRSEYRAAEENAWQGGAVGVINKLDIE